jgi:hypothetical protein
MTSCRSEAEAYEQCKKDANSSSCENQYQALQQCRSGFFYEGRIGGGSGLVYRPTPQVELNSKGANFILHEDENVVIGTQGVQFKIFGVKI